MRLGEEGVRGMSHRISMRRVRVAAVTALLGTLVLAGAHASRASVLLTPPSTVLSAPLGSPATLGTVPSNASIVGGSGAVTIGASGGTAVATPAVSAPPDLLVGEADGYVDLPVSLSAPGTSTVTVAYATANSTAFSGTACNATYVGVSGTVTFAPGETTKVVRVDLNDCGLSGFRAFTFNLSTPTSATIARASTQVGIVGDAVGTGTPGLYARGAMVANGAGIVEVPVLLGGPAGAASKSTVTVDYATQDESAVAGSDYTASSGTLTFAPGQTVANVPVVIDDQAGAQPTRRFTITLSNPSNASIVGGSGAVTIGASGGTAVATPAVSAPPDLLVGEADGYVDLPVSLSAPGTSTVTVAYATANSTAFSGTACNATYVGVSGTVTFAPGETTKVVRVDLNDCGLSGFRAFTFNLSTPTSATIARASTQVGIVGDAVGTGTPGLYARGAMVANGAGIVEVPVLLGGPAGAASKSTVTVDYATQDESAVAGSDYTASSGTLTFAPGQTVANVPVVIDDQAGAQPTRRFTITLSNPSNASIVGGSGAVTIGASGGTAVATPAVSAPPDLLVGEADGYVDLPVSLSAPGTSTVTVAYATANSTAFSGTACNSTYVGVSGTVTFAPGETTKVVRVDLNDCGLSNPGTFTFNLSSPTKATIARASEQIQIVEGSLAGTTQAVYVPTDVLLGAPYDALFRASGLVNYVLVGAPSWLTVSSTGAVTGVPPAGTTSFSFSVSATGSTTAGPFTVTVERGVPVSGTVTSSDGTKIAGAPVEDCVTVTVGDCQRTVTSLGGSFTLEAAPGASIVLTAFPPSGSQLVKASTGAITVPAEGVSGVRLVESGTSPLPPGLLINGQSTRPIVNWSVPSTATLTGCPEGVATVSIVGQNTSTGKYDYKVIPLTETSETSPGSGTYVGTIPPLYPIHGPVSISDSVTCPPESPLLPNSGPASGGNTVAITGSGFTDATAVSFGGVPATSFTVEADDLIEAVAPPGAGTVPVNVTADGSSQVVDDYTYVAITSISPQGGPEAGGTAVNIVGTGLESAERVLFGDTAVAFTQVSDDEIEAVSPPGSGTQDITVVTPFGGTTPVTPSDQFTYGASMSTTGQAKSTTSTPSSGQGVSTHLLGAPAPTMRSQLAKPLTARIAPWQFVAKWVIQQANKDLSWIAHYHIQELADLAVAYQNPTCQTTHAVLEDLTSDAVEIAAAPFVAPLKLGWAAKAIGKWAGAGWSKRLIKQAAIFGDTRAIDEYLKKISKGAVDAYFGACPGEKLAGNAYIDPSGTVLDTNGNPVSGATVTISRSDSAAGPFAPVEPSSPGITPAVNPETTGEDGVFHWDVWSGFYELQASNAGCADPNQAGSSTATIGPYPVPPPQVGLVITLACPNEPPPPTPSVTSLSLAGGEPAGGTQVTILGTGFTPSSSVTFGGAVASVTYLSSEALAVVSPPGAGLVDVVVHNSGKNSATSDADQFFYGAPPAVTGLSVDHGSASGGTSVTVSGSGFTGATDVAFGGFPAASFSVVSDTEITAVAPATPAGVADVLVVTPAGGSATTSSDHFTFDPVTQTITFTSTAPTSPAVGGTYAVTATASSGLPVVFSIDPASTSGCSIQESTVSFSAPAGTCVIDADQRGDGSFSSAPRQQQVVTVSETLTPTFSLPRETLTVSKSGTGAPNSQFSALAASVNQRTGAVTFKGTVSQAGTFSWLLTFQNGKFGVFTASSKKCGKGQVKLTGKCRPALITYAKGSRAVAAGAFSFTVKPTASALKALQDALKHRRGLPVTATVTFQSSLGGRPTTQTQTPTVKLKTKRK